jgi:hypothetical protein
MMLAIAGNSSKTAATLPPPGELAVGFGPCSPA